LQCLCEISRQLGTSLSIAEILLFIKRWSKIAVATIANINARQRTVRQRLCNFCINKNNMVA